MGVGVGAGGGVGYELVQHLDCNLPTYRLLAPVQSPVRGRSQLLLRLIIHVVCRLDAPCYEAPMRTPAAAAGRCRLRQWGHPATRAVSRRKRLCPLMDLLLLKEDFHKMGLGWGWGFKYHRGLMRSFLKTGYAARAMLQGLWCRGYAAGAMS